MTAGTSCVEVEIRDNVMWITLARPAAMNALSPAMLEEIDAAMARAQTDDIVRCVVFTGQGKAFCAGADLNTVPVPDGGLEGFLRKASGTMRRIAALTKPVIACINGITLAGGLELLLTADIVVAARSAEIGDGHIKFGLLPGAGGSVRLARAIGSGRARYLMFTGTRLPAAQLEAWGLVHLLCEDDALIEKTEALARSIANASPAALRALKALVVAGADLTLKQSLEMELEINKQHALSDDFREGLAAFAEKRKPVFHGH